MHPPTPMLTPTTPKLKLDWYEIGNVCTTLAAALPGSIEAICPVGRGGLVPASIVAYALRKPVLGLLPVIPMVRGFSDLGPALLIIDDVADTGQTFAEIRGCYPHAVYAAPYVKPAGRVYCDYWVKEEPQDRWLVFPWSPDDDINR